MNSYQPYPQQPQNDPQAQSSGYVPPPLYGNIQDETNNSQVEVKINPERQYITEKLTDIEKGLDSSFLKIYQIWLSLLCLSSFGGFIYIVYVLVAAKDPSNGLDIAAILLVLVTWVAIQCVYGLLAIYQKSVSNANIACWMMIVGLIPGVLLDVKLFVVFRSYPDPKDNWAPVPNFFIVGVSAQVLAHIVMSMIGAVQVRNILLERDLLKEKLKRVDDSFKA